LFAAKNVILAGVRALTIHDQKAVEVRDLSAQFYLTEEDVGQNRAEACKEKLQELNNAVDVSASTAQLTSDYLEQFQVGPQHSSSRIMQCNLLCHLLSLKTPSAAESFTCV
jgi:ubiquitin-activating enzyme E1